MQNSPNHRILWKSLDPDVWCLPGRQFKGAERPQDARPGWGWRMVWPEGGPDAVAASWGHPRARIASTHSRVNGCAVHRCTTGPVGDTHGQVVRIRLFTGWVASVAGEAWPVASVAGEALPAGEASGEAWPADEAVAIFL